MYSYGCVGQISTGRLSWDRHFGGLYSSKAQACQGFADATRRHVNHRADTDFPPGHPPTCQKTRADMASLGLAAADMPKARTDIAKTLSDMPKTKLPSTIKQHVHVPSCKKYVPTWHKNNSADMQNRMVRFLRGIQGIQEEWGRGSWANWQVKK